MSRIEFNPSILEKIVQQKNLVQNNWIDKYSNRRPDSKGAPKIETSTKTSPKNEIIAMIQQSKQLHKSNAEKQLGSSKSHENLLFNKNFTALMKNSQKNSRPVLSPGSRLQSEDSQQRKQIKQKQLSLATLNIIKEPIGKALSPQGKSNIHQTKTNDNKHSFQAQRFKTLSDESNDNFKRDLSTKTTFLKDDDYLKGIFSQKATSVNDLKLKQLLANHSDQQSPTRMKDKKLSQHGNKLLTVTIHYQGQRHTFQYECVDKTSGDLYNHMKTLILDLETKKSHRGAAGEGGTGSCEGDSNQQDPQRICQFQTTNKNIPIDYYLSMTNNSLSVFQGMSIQLQPYYSLGQKLQQIIIKGGSNKKVTLKDFTLLKCIGVGGFSRVYLVRKRDSGKFYALKLIDKKFIMDNQKEIIVQNERDIMMSIQNDFITPLHYAFETKFYIAFALEYCAGGELFYHLRKLRRLSESDAKFYFVEICIGMAYLHSKGIVYRDIKPENILLDLNGHLLLSDFGLSKPNMQPENFAYSFCGSPEYMAPEMLLKTGHNFLVDCYCLGALLYELVTGLPPFYSHNTQEIYNSILTEQIQFPPYVTISHTLQDLIKKLLRKEPTDRLGSQGGVAEVFTHPWFRDIDFDAIINKRIKTPYTPEPLKYNFDEEEFNKGDAEFRKIYNQNLQKEVYDQNLVLKNFYFSREQSNIQNESSPVNISKQSIKNNFSSDKNNSPKQQSLLFSVDQAQKNIQRLKQGKSEILDFPFNDPIDKQIKAQILEKKGSAVIQQNLKQSGHSYSKTLQMQFGAMRPVKQESKQCLKVINKNIAYKHDIYSSERVQTQPDQITVTPGVRIKTDNNMIHSSSTGKNGQTTLKNELQKLQIFLEKSKQTNNKNKKYN